MKKTLFKTIMVLGIVGLMLAGTVTIALADETPTFRGIVYDYNGQFIELTPMQYVQFRGATNPDLKALVIDPDTSNFRPLQAIVDSRGYVFTVIKYVQTGKNYSNLVFEDQVSNLTMRLPNSVQVVSQVINLIPRDITLSNISIEDINPVITNEAEKTILTFDVDPETRYSNGTASPSEVNLKFKIDSANYDIAEDTANDDLLQQAIDLLKLYSGDADKTGVLGSTLINESPITVRLTSDITGVQKIYEIIFE